MQGQSYVTEDKMRGFLSIIETNLRVAKATFERLNFPCRYFHFDLHGGSGHNEQANVIDLEPICHDCHCKEHGKGC